ncbi:hypothetical protein EV182_000340 [Spiromyces aspiralis]|uniref:Uncharacterized protein n=1 Tax=Spiromyces aspiralis TaxID=68401 RepID=A0ACC1HJR4_9FUNG|nr:hypothetical protein EV182_000340 [Spiromyces aspiralis]
MSKDWGGQRAETAAEKYQGSQNTFLSSTATVHRVLQLMAFLDWRDRSKHEAAVEAKTAAALSTAARKKLISECQAETIKRACSSRRRPAGGRSGAARPSSGGGVYRLVAARTPAGFSS